ncbi:MAG: hypothetical protein QFE16_00070 [Pseudomonadota bacterium]|nr:hypothetical protein [Pseudomonadota bacterium]
MIEATLARTATSNTNDPFQEDDLATDAAPADAEIPPPARVVEPTPTAAATAGWCVVFKRIGQWLGLGSRP